MFTRQNSANLRKMLLLAAVTVATSSLTGCQMYPYSGAENKVYGYVNKFSTNIPKGFVRNEVGKGVVYHDPGLVLKGDENESKGSGRLVAYMSRNGSKGLVSGYTDLDEMKPWLEREAEDRGKLKSGSFIYFGFVSVQADPVFGQAVAIIKDEGAVVYVKQDNQWRRAEIAMTAINWSEEGPFAWFQDVKDRAGEQVPKEQVQRYIILANNLSRTYLNKEIVQ